MKRVQENGKWTLMCPANVLGCMMYMVRSLKNVYWRRGRQGRNNQSAGVVGEKILESQIDWNALHVI
jgi:hypothetical protein